MINNENFEVINTEFTEDEIRSRVRVFKDNILWFDEMPYPTLTTVRIIFDEIERLSEPFDHFFFIVNLTEMVGLPKPDIRRELTLGFKQIRNRLIHAAAFTGKNMIINASARFVLGSLGSIAVKKTKEEAIKSIEDVIKQ